MWKPPWYAGVEKKLIPLQWVVTLGLVIIVGLSIWAIVSGDNIKRTVWFVYLLSP